MTVMELVLADNAYQTFDAQLNNIQTTWTFRWNAQAQRWFFDLQIDGGYRIMGRKVILNIDLLDEYPGLNEELGYLICYDYTESGNSPGRVELPSRRCRLYHLTPDELANAEAVSS